jgi:hypothetical protein
MKLRLLGKINFMKRKKKYLRYSKERAILSDVLPYEAPVNFSNRYLYRFLVNNRIELKENKLIFIDKYSGNESKAYREILKLLFDAKNIQVGCDYVVLKKYELKKTPFLYKIAHKDSDFRELTIIHPLNQLSLVEFYEKYKEQIIYYSSVSKFSLRKPQTVAKFVFFNDKLHHLEKGNPDDFLELRGKEYENLKSFFAYRKYTNIYRFYEDYRYQRAEKKFKILYKFDITKCFDSIYTHSITWALINKEIVKDSITKSESTFGGQFDRFMQNLNYGETNGIVIGPEFSRIFSELILQQIDKSVEYKLRNEKELFNKRHYEIYRYVDDYFLFCDKEADKECIVKYFRHELKEYKMALHDLKSKSYVKPMITEISIAKQKINQLFEKEPVFKILEKEKLTKEEEEDENITIFDKHAFKFYINSNKLASKFKTIVKESNVEYKDVLNYTLAILNNKIERILLKFELKFKTYCELDHNGQLTKEQKIKKKNLESRFTKFLVGYIDFVFFLFSVSPRVNSSIKLCGILSKILKYYNGSYKMKIGSENKSIPRLLDSNQDLIYKKISDDVSLILERHEMDKHTQVEILYLLIVLRELGKNYRLNEHQLAKYFNCYDSNANKVEVRKETQLNYFSIVVLLFYIKDIKIYSALKDELKAYILHYIGAVPVDKRKNSTETILLLMDLIVCPYLDDGYKTDLLQKFNVDISVIPDIIAFKNKQKYWFVNWENFDLDKELNSKNSEEVYS